MSMTILKAGKGHLKFMSFNKDGIATITFKTIQLTKEDINGMGSSKTGVDIDFTIKWTEE